MSEKTITELAVKVEGCNNLESDADKENLSWCGRRVKNEFTFQNIDHAVYEIERNGRLLPCQDCVKAITDLLER